ncbi:hypothetical protein SSX86_006862 [Deinandra increscens subsp. villosa]|uniref:WRKY domain-containing protein n=1 Tax=Deinandra increscens subsp. villosa TaxID=3103831 RepID=A0AAP0H941_9ASTR
MDSDWDLQAVVRGCSSAVSAASSSATTATATAPTWPPDGGLLNYNLYNTQKPPQKLPPPPQRFQISPFTFLGGCQDPPYRHHYHHQQPPEKQFQIKQQSLGVSRCTSTHAQSTTKIKKRKNQIKKVCQVPADGSSPDLWSWRKYGQKPIKGSPYPRGYYRCSTLKGCSARKQVERNRSDPGMLTVTYTGEHTHPVPTQLNSLAGSTRNKTTAPSPPVSPAASLPSVPEKMDENDSDDDNNFDVSGIVIDEDTFDGLDELVAGSAVGDVFSDHLDTMNPQLPWWSNNLTTTTTTAAGGS